MSDRQTRASFQGFNPVKRLERPVEGAAYLTAEQVGELLQLSAKSIYRLAKSDPTMPMLKLGGTVRFPRERLERWLRDREQGPRMRRPVLSVANPASGKDSANA